MTMTGEMLERLGEPLDPSRVKIKPGGRRNRYLETYDVQATANSIFGYDGWSQEQVELRCLGEHQITRPGAKPEDPERSGWIVGYRCTMRVRVGETVREDTGYGDAIEYGDNPIPCHELAVKEAVSDAVKRAFKSLGDQFGLCLYDKTGGAASNGASGASQTQRAARGGGGGGTPSATISEAQNARLHAVAGDFKLTDRELRHVCTMATGRGGVAESLKAILKDEYEQVESLVRSYGENAQKPSSIAQVKTWREKNPTLAQLLDAKQPKGDTDAW